MRYALVTSVAVLAGALMPAAASAGKYTARELGFVEVGPRPYRLAIFFDDQTAIAAKLAEIGLAGELLYTNMGLELVARDRIKDLPEFQQVKLPDKLSQPAHWIIGLDGRARAIDWDADKRSLLCSPLREALLEDAVRSLCTLVLLESSDVPANAKVRAKTEAVLAQLNADLAKLDRAPAGAIPLRVVTVEQRGEERWTLWSLGEDAAPPKAPKLAILFGNLRPWGPMLEGAAWEERELFARIAALGQFADAGVERRFTQPAPLVLAASKEWQQKVRESLSFAPQQDDVKDEVRAILQKTPVERVSNLSYVDRAPDARATPMTAMEQADPLEPDDGFPTLPPEPPAPEWKMPAAVGPEAATTILLAGIAGWVILGLTARFLERRQDEYA